MSQTIILTADDRGLLSNVTSPLCTLPFVILLLDLEISFPRTEISSPIIHCVLSMVVLAYGSLPTSLTVIIISLQDLRMLTASWWSISKKLRLLTSNIWSPTWVWMIKRVCYFCILVIIFNDTFYETVRRTCSMKQYAI